MNKILVKIFPQKISLHMIDLEVGIFVLRRDTQYLSVFSLNA